MAKSMWVSFCKARSLDSESCTKTVRVRAGVFGWMGSLWGMSKKSSTKEKDKGR